MRPKARQEELQTCSVHDGMRRLAGLLPRVTRGLHRGKERKPPEFLRDAHLGPRHAKALYHLLDGPKTVGELAADLDLELATVSGMVAELDRAGLVERQQDPADRRRTLVTIVPERRPQIDTWLSEAAAPILRTLERLSPADRAVFVNALDVLDQELTAAGRTDPLDPIA
jgi:DNA-binding MarR family transcriptional regulator